ncbi:Prepilin peptidase [Alteripontixanthobacter maritimus]|uniref:Prepilin peptidase n=1 Tax=Alteripontixanthobacter maritimus TaxID=2161824 RepID=A0A369QAJ0_9SPHN|nr:prepilin peptidase [Alteripontixanthobacter maritimus]RDC59298.1 Prepilin peptidase [Alteripontixanthobacter maritimus]
MLDEYLHYGLLCALAIALLYAAFTDLRSRRIANWLTAAIAVAAPLFWWASGLSLYPGVLLQLGVAAASFVVLAGLFALRAMGGGDVKLLTALALWITPMLFLKLLIIMAITGGILTIVFGGWHIMRRRKDRLAIPYGIAIAIAGLWIIGAHSLPAAQKQLQTGNTSVVAGADALSNITSKTGSAVSG